MSSTPGQQPRFRQIHQKFTIIESHVDAMIDGRSPQSIRSIDYIYIHYLGLMKTSETSAQRKNPEAVAPGSSVAFLTLCARSNSALTGAGGIRRDQ
jgi:hypothetical protein